MILDFATSQAKFQLIDKRPVPNKRPGGQKLNLLINDQVLNNSTRWSKFELINKRPVVVY